MDKQICIILLGKNNPNSKTNWGETFAIHITKGCFLNIKKKSKTNNLTKKNSHKQIQNEIQFKHPDFQSSDSLIKTTLNTTSRVKIDAGKNHQCMLK